LLAPKFLNIRDILQKDENKIYTKEALLYQNILEFPLKTNTDQFKFSELGRWLIKNNKEFRESYDRDRKYSSKTNTTITYAVLKKKDRIEKKIKDLIELGALYQSGWTKSEKLKDHEVPLYSLTGDGYFIALLLLRNESPDKINQLYDFIQFNLQINDSYHNLLFSKIYQKCKRIDMLETAFIIIEEFLANTLDDRTVFDAILSISQAETYDRSIQEKLRDIRLQALMEVDLPARVSYLLYVKSSLDEIMIRQHPPKRWEDIRLFYLDDYSTTVMYAWCHDCMWEDYVGIDIMEYLRNLTLDSVSVHAPCPECNGNNLHASTSIPHHPIKLTFY
jgi:hypothetical protein